MLANVAFVPTNFPYMNSTKAFALAGRGVPAIHSPRASLRFARAIRILGFAFTGDLRFSPFTATCVQQSVSKMMLRKLTVTPDMKGSVSEGNLVGMM